MLEDIITIEGHTRACCTAERRETFQRKVSGNRDRHSISSSRNIDIESSVALSAHQRVHFSSNDKCCTNRLDLCRHFMG